MALDEHRKRAPKSVRCSVIVTSDTRDRSTDESGAFVVQMLKDAGHEVVHYRIVPNHSEDLTTALEDVLDSSQAVVVSGGTGLSKRDITVDTIAPLLNKTLSGFGELFRQLSYGEIGSAAILSRATAGSIDARVVFCLPGSTRASRLAMEQLILPELSHIVGELEK